MSKTINMDEADQWSEEERLNNIKYLEDRGRYEEAAPLREAQGLPPVERVENPDIDLLLEQDRIVTSRYGTNDTPEYDPGQPQQVTIPGGSRQVGRTRDKDGEVGPHGANSDQFVPTDEDEERNTKNRSEGADRKPRGGASGGSGGRRAKKAEGEDE